MCVCVADRLCVNLGLVNTTEINLARCLLHICKMYIVTLWSASLKRGGGGGGGGFSTWRCVSISLQTAWCRKSASQWNVDVLHDEVKSSGDLTLRHSASHSDGRV